MKLHSILKGHIAILEINFYITRGSQTSEGGKHSTVHLDFLNSRSKQIWNLECHEKIETNQPIIGRKQFYINHIKRFIYLGNEVKSLNIADNFIKQLYWRKKKKEIETQIHHPHHIIQQLIHLFFNLEIVPLFRCHLLII